MRAIICDICGIQQPNIEGMAAAEITVPMVGGPAELHFCRKCTTKFLKWVADEATKEKDHKEANE